VLSFFSLSDLLLIKLLPLFFTNERKLLMKQTSGKRIKSGKKSPKKATPQTKKNRQRREFVVFSLFSLLFSLFSSLSLGSLV